MHLKSQKEMAAKILKCGVSRIRIKASKEVEEALTREDIRDLIKKGMIKKIQKKGVNRSYARIKLKQKKKGRRMGVGSRKGSMGARVSKKRSWIKTVKTVRKLLRELVASGQVEKKNYRKLYLMIKGGSFRDKKHMLLYLKEHELLKKRQIKPKKSKK